MRLISFWNWVMIYRIFGASPKRWRVSDWISCCVRPQIKGILLLQITGLRTRTMRQRIETKPRSHWCYGIIDDIEDQSLAKTDFYDVRCVYVDLEYSISNSTLTTAICTKNEHNFFFSYLESWLTICNFFCTFFIRAIIYASLWLELLHLIWKIMINLYYTSYTFIIIHK